MDKEKRSAIVDVLKTALKRETEAFNYYSKAIFKSPYPETRTLLQQLAEEERKHRYFVGRELKKIEALLSHENETAFISEDQVQYNIPDKIDDVRLQSVPGIEIHGFSMPAVLIGGDFLDTVRLDHADASSLGLFLYDVMGHGIEATQLKACARRLFANLRDGREEGDDRIDHPNRVMSYINAHLQDECRSMGRFVTAFYGIFSPHEDRLFYTSAGHEPPLLFKKNGEYEHLSETELLLGADPEVMYNEVEIALDPGDVLIVFSDGIIEATNRTGDMFERDGLIKAVQDHIHKSPENILETIFDTLRIFLDGEPMTDECTIVVLKLNQSPVD